MSKLPPEIEKIARNLHEWYLEATRELNPESYNAKAQVAYDDLTPDQQAIDIYIAKKVAQELATQREKDAQIASEFMYRRDGLSEFIPNKAHDVGDDIAKAIRQEGL